MANNTTPLAFFPGIPLNANFVISEQEDRWLGEDYIGTAEGDAPDEPDGHYRMREGFRYDTIWGDLPRPMRGLITEIDNSHSDDLTAEWCEWMDWIDTDFPLWTEEDLAWIDELE